MSIDLTKMDRDDRVFWERLEEMPWLEAEQECVIRREDLCLQLAVVNRALSDTGKESRAGRELAGAVHDINGQLGLLNERIKFLRKAQDRISWGKAVTALWGEEGYAACRAWMEAQRVEAGAPK
jgi:hypothetical protein